MCFNLLFYVCFCCFCIVCLQREDPAKYPPNVHHILQHPSLVGVLCVGPRPACRRCRNHCDGWVLLVERLLQAQESCTSQDEGDNQKQLAVTVCFAGHRLTEHHSF